MKDISQYLPENIVRGEREGFIKREGQKKQYYQMQFRLLSNGAKISIIKRIPFRI